MAKNLIISVLAAFFITAVIGKAIAAGPKKPRPLTDGFVLAGIDGELTSPDSNEASQYGTPDSWFFGFDSDISDGRGRIDTGTTVELLPSAVLEKMLADAKERPAAGYRLWGRITKYKDRNFIFPVYFLPITKVKPPQSQTSQSSQQETKITINDPNDALTIPQEVITKLKTRKIVQVEQLKKGFELKADCILADRTGFIVEQASGEFVFTLDALGWNVQRFSIRLLPCRILERAQQKQSTELEQLRFKVAGIVTQYKGQNYLLLQRALRVYSHENFGR